MARKGKPKAYPATMACIKCRTRIPRHLNRNEVAPCEHPSCGWYDCYECQLRTYISGISEDGLYWELKTIPL